MATCIPPEDMLSKNQCQVCWNLDEKKVRANYQCVTCPKQLCDGCKLEHEQHETFSEHEIKVFVQDLNIVVKCHLHTGDDADGWCVTCRLLLCSDCVQGEHIDHDIDPVKDSIQAMQTYHQSIPFIRDELKQNMSDMKATSEMLEEDMAKTIKMVEDHRDKLIAEIQTKTDDIIRNLEDQYQSQLDAPSILGRHESMTTKSPGNPVMEDSGYNELVRCNNTTTHICLAGRGPG